MLKIACAHKRLVIGQKISHPSINISFQFRNPFQFYLLLQYSLNPRWGGFHDVAVKESSRYFCNGNFPFPVLNAMVKWLSTAAISAQLYLPENHYFDACDLPPLKNEVCIVLFKWLVDIVLRTNPLFWQHWLCFALLFFKYPPHSSSHSSKFNQALILYFCFAVWHHQCSEQRALLSYTRGNLFMSI